MTLLAMLRHAETAWSAEGRIQGRADIALSDIGRLQLRGRILPEAFRGMRVATSPLRRCVETAAELGLSPVTHEARLAEMRWGAWEGRRLVELRTELGEAMRENESRGFDFSPPDGETPRNVLERVRGWITEVALSGRPTLAITHRGVIRVVFAAATGWDMRGRPSVKLDWAALHAFRLNRDGTFGVHKMNVPLLRGTRESTAGPEK